MTTRVIQPATTTEDIDYIIDAANDKVEQRFEQAIEDGRDLLQSTMEIIGALGDSIGEASIVVADLGSQFPDPISIYFNPGDPPTAPEVELYMPEFPTAPILSVIEFLTGIQTKLEYDLAHGGTGLNPDVELEIWRRGEERDRIVLDNAKEKIAAETSKRGFALPDGSLAAQLTQAETEYMNKRVDVSRDIAIKQAELSYQYSIAIIQQILAMEKILIDATAEGNKSLIEEYKADMDGYKAKVQGAVEKLGALLKAYEVGGNVYRAKADAQAAIAGVDVKVAEANINTAVSKMQLFLKQAEVNMRDREVFASLHLEAQKAAGQIAAQLSAGIFAGVSVQAHISAGATASKSYSGQEQSTESHPHQELPA
jgi:hypothetical protein